MKQFKTAFVFAALFLITFAGIPSKSSSFQDSSQPQIAQSALRTIYVQFSFTWNNCTYTVFAMLSTTTGNGYGSVTQNCGGNVRIFGFTIYGATVIRGTEPCHLIDFMEDNQSIDIDPAIKTEIANGINENWPDDETED